MIWKVLGVFGSGSFFLGGFNIATDPNCDSVSFRGGGARSVLMTCYTDTTGDFSKSVAASGSLLVAIAILIVVFWKEINVYIRNLELVNRFKSGPEEGQAGYEDKFDIAIETSFGTDKELNEATSRFQYFLTQLKFRVKQNKIIFILLILVLILGFYKGVAPKIPLFDSLTCSSIRSEVKKMDVVRRDIWNQYQVEVSRLGQINYDEYELQANQVSNVARRMVQLKSSDLEVLDLVLQSEHCLMVQKNELLKLRSTIQDDLDILLGKKKRNLASWNPDSGWNPEYYRIFVAFSKLVDK